MILIWKGRGWLIAILFLLAYPFASSLASYMSLIDNYKYETLWIMSFIMIYAGIFTKTFFVIFPKKSDEKYINYETKEIVTVRHKDSFFFVDVNIWAYALLSLGAFFLCGTLLQLIL